MENRPSPDRTALAPTRARLRAAAVVLAALSATAASTGCLQGEEIEPSDQPALAVSEAKIGLASAIPESVTIGTSEDLDAYAPEAGFALPPGQAMIEIVGMAIAAGDDHVFTWFADGTVSSGHREDLGHYTAPVPFIAPGNRAAADIVGVGIGSNAHTYAWYRDGTVSEGTSEDLGFYSAPVPFTVAAGETIHDLVGIDFNSNGRVYAWYRDGKHSVGNVTDLDACQAAVASDLPPGQVPRHIVEMAIDSSNRVHTWFQDMENGSAPPAVADAVDGIIVDKLRALRAAGLTVAISKGGRMILERAYGYRDVDTQESRMPWHRSKIGSVSKVITALGVTKYAEGSASFALTSLVYGSNGALKDPAYNQAMVAGMNRHKPLVGFAVSPTNAAYAWYENQTVSWGDTLDLGSESGPAQAFSMPPGKTTNDILGIAMSSTGDVYAWYRDLTYSIGTPTDLDSVSAPAGVPLKWAPAADMSVAHVLGVAMRKSDDRVFAWYLDGTYSSGSPESFDASSPRESYSPAAGKTIYDLRDADFGPSGMIYFHYGDSASVGSAAHLDRAGPVYSSALASAPVVNNWLSWYGGIQVRHLLNHSAGIWGSGDEPGAAVMFNVESKDLTYAQDHLFVLSTRSLLWAPGTNDEYSNHSVGLAGHVLATVSGMPYETYIRTKILTPLGLTRVVPVGTGDFAYDATPHGVDEEGRLITQTLAPSENLNGLAAGGYSAAAGDLVRLMLATDKLSNHPDILAASSLTKMETPPFPTTVPGRALGWDYSKGKLGKGGDISGGNAYITKFPATFMLGGVNVGGMTIALCANGGVSSGELRVLANTIATAAGAVQVDPLYDLF